MSALAKDLESWLSAHAEQLDAEAKDAALILPALAGESLFGIGLSEDHGGSGGDVADAVEAIAAVSEQSLTAGFVFWGHRTFIEYLLQSANTELRARLLPDLLAGRRGGATGLSNAMKFLAGIEELRIKARDASNGSDLILDGKMPWVTNLRPDGFEVAAAVEGAGQGPAFVGVLSSEDAGLERSADLELMAMRASNTAAITIRGVRIGAERILHPNTSEWLPRVRPAFLGLQCGMSIGLARRALEEVRRKLDSGRHVLGQPVESLQEQLQIQISLLKDGLRNGQFVEGAAGLFQIRIELADIAAAAVQLELQASGGAAYLSKPGRDIQRRLREVAFIPLVTPSLVQLKSALHASGPTQQVAVA
jgi:alkylation response protein AidB-like acyl-CoA dehydrogenase